MRMPVLVPCAIAVIPFDAEFAQEGPGAATELFNLLAGRGSQTLCRSGPRREHSDAVNAGTG